MSKSETSQESSSFPALEKTVTIYQVASDTHKMPFTTKSKASYAVALLGQFGVKANIETVKKTITL